LVALLAQRHRHSTPPIGSTWHVVPSARAPPHVGGLVSEHVGSASVVVVVVVTRVVLGRVVLR
jgi:hypothetical protein